jgi:hypothetical protein
MSKQELLAWTSLGTSVSVIFFYVLFAFGWPEILPDYSEQFSNIFFNVFWIALVAEIIIESNEGKKEVNKDERDFMIEARGLKHAYSFLSVVIIFMLGHLFLNNIFGGQSEIHAMVRGPEATFHALFIALFASNIVKRITQLYYYQIEF